MWLLRTEALLALPIGTHRLPSGEEMQMLGRRFLLSHILPINGHRPVYVGVVLATPTSIVIVAPVLGGPESDVPVHKTERRARSSGALRRIRTASPS